MGATYGEGRHKKLGKELTAEVGKKKAEEIVQNEPKNYQKLENDLSVAEAAHGKTSAQYLAAEAALMTSVDKLTQAMKLVGANYIKDMTLDGSPEGVNNRAFIDSDAFRKSSRAEHWKALEARDDISTSDLAGY